MIRSIRLILCSALILAAQFGQSQTVTTFAGQANDSDPWTNFNNTTVKKSSAYFYEPHGIAWDASGRMYITERNKIRLINGDDVYNRTGNIGDGQKSHGYKDGTGNAGWLYNPTGVALDADGNAIIVDSENHAIRKLTKFVNAGNQQVLSTVAGDKPDGTLGAQGTPGYADGMGTNSRFDTPKGIIADGKGNFYVTDFNNFCIRKISSTFRVTTLAGKAGSDGSTDGNSGADSRFGGPYGIAMYDANNIIITDNWNSSIRKVNVTTGKTTTLCGKFGNAFYKDGTLTDARFKNPKGIVVVDGLIYVADDGVIRVIDEKNNTVSTFAGSQSGQGNTDGVGDKARFGRLGGLAYDGSSALYVTDVYFNLIKKVTIDNLAPSADVTATKEALQVNEETTLSDASGGRPATSRKWTVTKQTDGTTTNVVLVSGDLNSSKDITVKFTATGFYKVTLEVSNEFGTDQVIKDNFLNVSRTGSVNSLQDLGSIDVYPNPNSGKSVTIRLEDGVMNDASISLFDIHGKLLSQYENINGFSAQLDLPDLNNGTYFLQIEHDGFSGVKRLVVH